MGAPLRLTLFGGFDARLGSGPPIVLPRKCQALVAYLALAGKPSFAREDLAALLWGDTGDVQARQSLRKALFLLRQAINDGGLTPLVISNATVGLERGSATADVWDFEDLGARGTAEATARAASLYRGELLAGLTVDETPFADWLAAERRRLNDAALRVFTGLLDQQARGGEATAALETASRLVALDPLHEPGHRALMRLYVADGRPAAALRQYQACVDRLHRELGVEPAPETRRLYEDILREHSRAPAAVVAPRPAAADRPEPATPLIGRDAEAARLAAAMDAALRGHPAVVALVGEAGIGKTRLLDHACAGASGRARILVGHSYPSEQILPFGPWADAFRAGGIVDDPVLRRPQRAAWRGELARLLPELGAAPSADDPARLFEAVVVLISDLAERAPLVVALEDMHWADDQSVRLLGFLARRLRDQRVVFVVTVRDEGLADAAALRALLRDLDHHRRLVRIELARLSLADTATLVHSLTPAAESPAARDRLAARIWQASEGNPLMAVETVRALDQGTPESDTELPIAERVRDVVLGRLERVSGLGRQLLDVAAAIGRDFEFPLLRRASDVDEGDAAAGVEELVRRRLLSLAGDGFRFTHDRIRDVVYAEILPPRRRLLHHRVAAALEALHAADPAPVSTALAFHYREAEAWEPTVRWSRTAGARAFVLGGQREAAVSFRQALEALAHLPEDDATLALAIDLRLDLRHALQPLSEVATVTRLMKEALVLAERLADPTRLGQTLAFLSTHHWWDGEHDEAIACARRALAIADERDDVRMRASAAYCEGQALQSLGDYTHAVTLFRGCLATIGGGLSSQRFGSTDFSRVWNASRLAACLAELGDFADAEDAAHEAVRTAERGRHPYLLSFAYRAEAWTCIRRGRFAETVDWLERLRELQDTGNAQVNFPLAHWVLAWVYALAGRPEADAVLRAGVFPLPSEIRVFNISQWLGCLAEACLLTGRTADAREVATRAVQIGIARGERAHAAWGLRVLGAAAASSGDLVHAERRYAEALDLARERGMRPLEAHCLLGLSDVQTRTARGVDARASLAGGEAIGRAIGLTAWLPGTTPAPPLD